MNILFPAHRRYDRQPGMSAAGLRASWLQELDAFKRLREKYLLYAD
ncbi:MAG: hypothetical protein LBS12_04345 [Prevotellaceae bacterium]|jgi:hypothetical protein|nr:hypothetical protein [Prevotellaceae bacterium]